MLDAAALLRRAGAVGPAWPLTPRAREAALDRIADGRGLRRPTLAHPDCCCARRACPDPRHGATAVCPQHGSAAASRAFYGCDDWPEVGEVVRDIPLFVLTA